MPPRAPQIVHQNLLMNKIIKLVDTLSITCEINAQDVTTNHEMIRHEPLVHVTERAREQRVQPPAHVHVEPNLLSNKSRQVIYILSVCPPVGKSKQKSSG